MFFEDYKNIERTMSIGITGLLSNITTREGSHKGGWARLLKCQLNNLGHAKVKILDSKDTLSDFDIIIFDLGAEYSGTLNMFGGLDEKVFKRLNELKSFTGPTFSWRNELPDIKVLESRRTNVSTCDLFKSSELGYLGSISDVLAKTQVFHHAYYANSLLIGDSHTPSVWQPSQMVERRDGRTLKGMVENKTIQKYLDQYDVEHVQVHCSAIDIRHHVMREANPLRSVADLAVALCEQLKSTGLKVTVTHTVGIEDESRELPKTGYFKGTAFYGSREERNLLRQIFNAVIEEYAVLNNWNVIKFPENFFDEIGKMKFDVMEKPQSVHLSPEYYKWDLDNNKERW